MSPVNTIKIGIVLPIAAITTSPNMMVGMERNASLIRLSTESRASLPTAAAIPNVTPTKYAISVASSAIPMVVRAPYKVLDNVSRPK